MLARIGNAFVDPDEVVGIHSGVPLVLVLRSGAHVECTGASAEDAAKLVNGSENVAKGETSLIHVGGSIEVQTYRADDGVIVVCIDSYGGLDENEDGTPRVRVRVNDALLHHESGRCTEVKP